MLDVSWRVFEESMDDKREIEQKASVILASSGILAGLSANVGLMFPVLIASVAAFFATLALNVRRYRRLMINKVLIEAKNSKDVDELKRSIVATLGDCEEFNLTNISRSAKFLKVSIWAFLLSIINLLFSLVFL